MSTNLYEILGVSKEATTEEIKKAYRKKALKCHPDKTSALPDNVRQLAEAEFNEINSAHVILTDSTCRHQYDQDDTIVFYKDQPEKTYTYQSGSGTFTEDGLNGRVKLTGASKIELAIHNDNNQTLKATFELAKDSLDPMLQRLNELVETLNNKAFKLDNSNHPVVINKKYEVVANQMTEMYYKIMFHMDTLRGTVIDYPDMLRALRASQEIVNEAQNDSEFANHRSFGRNCPVLRELCVCLDLMVNFFAFLDKKIGRTISGDKTPFFANMQEFKCGMFKPIPTSTARKVDELNEDMAWYIKEIEEGYKRAMPYVYRG
ncbi:MAG: J domain-containing protein [Legionellales bacterium]|nr:J domain-containing protein [Legionellales bacterium]